MTDRTRISLDGIWEFVIDRQGSLSPSHLDEAPCLDLAVPAPWQSQAPELRYYTGVGWYRRTFELPDSWGDRAVILGFDAADYRAEVWLNGEWVGEHEGGYLPFEFDVSHLVRGGVNRLIVRVDDCLEHFPEVPHGKQAWYGQLSGLWQPVWIEARPPGHIQKLRVDPGKQRVSAAVELSRPLQGEEQLVYEVFSPQGCLVSRSVTIETQVILPVYQPQLWDIDTPNLYTLRVSLAGPSPDAVELTFGFRTIETRQGQILLNGRPIYLRGALDQDYYPELDCTPPSLDFIEDQLRKAKNLGLNCLRLHIKIPDPRYYEAADRLGLLVWSELPSWQDLTARSRRRIRETLEGMVARDGHHPSIIIWTLVNESWGVDLTNPDHRRWLVETYHFMKRLDPTRLVVGNSACSGNHHVVTDIEDFHYYSAIPDHYRMWRRWVESLASRPPWTFARPYRGFQDWSKFLRRPWTADPYPPASEASRGHDEPLVVSEFGNWGLPDVQLLRAMDGSEPWWFESGFDWGEGVAYPHGIEQRFQAFHLERAFSSLSGLLEASQRMQYEALKYEIEQIRRQPDLSGYVITELTDVYWEANGLLDMNRNPKRFTCQLAALNADDVLVPDWRRLAYWAGEQAAVSLYLAHGSPADLDGSRVVWELEPPFDLHGILPELNPAPFAVIPAGTITFRVPPVSRPARLRLVFRLIDREGRQIHQNHLDLFFFPVREIPNPALRLYAPPALSAGLRQLGYTPADSLADCQAAVVTTLTDELREYLLSGGRVLWLAETKTALQTYLGTLKLLPRHKSIWQGDWISTLSWICRDVLFQDLPCDGLVDFLFAGLTPDYVLTGLNRSEFAHQVHAGIAAGWLHRIAALIARRRVGAGELLISTFRLSPHLTTHPTAALMLDDLLRYLQR